MPKIKYRVIHNNFQLYFNTCRYIFNYINHTLHDATIISRFVITEDISVLIVCHKLNINYRDLNDICINFLYDFHFRSNSTFSDRCVF